VDFYLHEAYHWHGTQAQEKIQSGSSYDGADNSIQQSFQQLRLTSTIEWLVNNGLERMWKEVVVV
jgi:hypothetical protein